MDLTTLWVTVALIFAVLSLVAVLVEAYNRCMTQKKLEAAQKALADRENKLMVLYCGLSNGVANNTDFICADHRKDGTDTFFEVFCGGDYAEDFAWPITIKRFYYDYKDENSRIYARNCAEELCDKLNEKP